MGIAIVLTINIVMNPVWLLQNINGISGKANIPPACISTVNFVFMPLSVSTELSGGETENMTLREKIITTRMKYVILELMQVMQVQR